MSCRYKNECPSYSGWCEGPKQDFSKCIRFLVTAYENIKEEAKMPMRLCKVGERLGYFHTWEHYSKPIEASPLIGGAPAGVLSCLFAIVEFADGVERVDPTMVQFCGEGSNTLQRLCEEKQDVAERVVEE